MFVEKKYDIDFYEEKDDDDDDEDNSNLYKDSIWEDEIIITSDVDELFYSLIFAELKTLVWQMKNSH